MRTQTSVLADDAIERLEAYRGYQAAQPFPHVVIDGLFDPEALRAILREWPVLDNTSEAHDDGTFVRSKVTTTWRTPHGPVTRDAFAELQAPRFLQALHTLTDAWGLMGDPYMVGGGLHSTRAGGTLAVHADFNKHPIFKLDRRLNLLTYLNENWSEENGGWLELWDSSMSACQTRILPIFNRTVIFSTNSTSFHGQPEPILGQEDLWRRSLALYYYSNGRADEGLPPEVGHEHSTLWQQRPDEGY